MDQTATITPKKRIDSIDALRGIALIRILLWHSIEHFDLGHTHVLDSPFWQAINDRAQGLIWLKAVSLKQS